MGTEPNIGSHYRREKSRDFFTLLGYKSSLSGEEHIEIETVDMRSAKHKQTQMRLVEK